MTNQDKINLIHHYINCDSCNFHELYSSSSNRELELKTIKKFERLIPSQKCLLKAFETYEFNDEDDTFETFIEAFKRAQRAACEFLS